MTLRISIMATFECDDCGKHLAVFAETALPKWVQNGKVPKGWGKIAREIDGRHEVFHHCPECSQLRRDENRGC